jgi:hypothetical protein
VVPSTNRSSCPHCGSVLRSIRLPEELGFAYASHLVCFNNNCSYYREGWAWMQEQYAVNASYRYRVDSSTGTAFPLPVWSETAMTDKIIEDQDES